MVSPCAGGQKVPRPLAGPRSLLQPNIPSPAGTCEDQEKTTQKQNPGAVRVGCDSATWSTHLDTSKSSPFLGRGTN